MRSLNTLYFYLTEGCNLACRHCWMGPRFDPTGKKYPTLPVEMFETAIREAKPLGLSGVKLTGGEPLLHPEFSRLLEIVRRESLRLTVETNGLLCTPAIAADLARFPKKPFVSVSLDGVDAATHDWVRGVPGSFEAACQAVRNLVDAGIKPQIIFSLMRHNADQASGMVRLAEKLGAGSLKFNVVQPTARGEQLHDTQETLTINELIDMGRYVEQKLAPSAMVRLIFHYPPAFRSLRRIADGNACSICGIFGILGVMATGHYALCGIGEQTPELVFGKVGVDPLDKVWRENKMLKELREGLPDRLEGVCGRCLMKARCLGSCVAQNYYSKGSLWAPYWFCEQAEAAGLFPVSRLSRGPEADVPPPTPEPDATHESPSDCEPMPVDDAPGEHSAMAFVAYSGSSMHPTLREPAILEVIPYEEGQPPRAGDVVFFHEPEADRAFVHRIVRVTAEGLSTRGDNNARDDAFLLQPGNIQGRVVAAWQGRKRRRIAGGFAGRLLEPGRQGRQAMRRRTVALLDPLYRTLSRWGGIARALPTAFRLRLVVFRHNGQDRFELLLGSRVVGRYDDRMHQWLIRRPFNLLVENKSLPTPPARRGSVTPRFAGDTLP